MDRKPIVAGRFYPGNESELRRDIHGYMQTTPQCSEAPTILAMVPHAGYVYSGAIAGETIAQANLAQTVILLGPNHTGHGAILSLWPDGKWLFPGGSLAIDTALASAIISACPAIEPEYTAHLQEHSLEVQLPLLHAKNPATRIVPISISEPHPENLLALGALLAEVIRTASYPVSIVVSSDMSHYISASQARTLDGMAIDQIQALSPKGLFTTVRDHRISMCGILPMTLGLKAACDLGATKASLVRYANSGEVNQDFDQVVGYAGIIVE